MVWQYTYERTAPFPAGPAEFSWDPSGYADAIGIADGKIYCDTLGHTAYADILPAYWKSEDGTMWNPYPYEVLAQPGTGEVTCLDAEYGSLIWKTGVEEIGSPGPCFGNYAGSMYKPLIADGRVYNSQNTYSGHVGVGGGDTGVPGTSRPYGSINYKQMINYEWFPPYVYCWGKGPTRFEAVCYDKGEIKYGENVTISGKLVDLSPAIDNISILSNYTRPVGSPAPDVPVVLSFISANGTKVPFATVETGKDGMFNYSWYPWETGSLSIIVESAGSDAYEAPDTTYTTVSVTPMTPDLVPLLEFATFVAIIVAIALPVIIYLRKP
jgi:hypothetical protein